jgi:hypothetical protein
MELTLQLWHVGPEGIVLETEFEFLDAEHLRQMHRTPVWVSPHELLIEATNVQWERTIDGQYKPVWLPGREWLKLSKKGEQWTAQLNGADIDALAIDERYLRTDEEYRNFNEIDWLAVGKQVYVDRDYLFVSVPESLKGHPYIRVANSETRKTEETYLRFDLFEPATIYVALGAQASHLPGWMDASWEPSTEVLATNDIELRLYQKHYEPGEVRMGGNWMPPAAGIRAHYVVIVVPD